MTDWRERLGALDELRPSDDVLRRARRGPSRPAPDDRPRRGSRVAAAVTAIAVFALAGGFAWQTLRTTERQPISTAPSPGSVVPLGDDGSTLWPERTSAALHAAQDLVDAGRDAWRLDAREVATRFTTDILGWPDGSFSVQSLEPSADDGVHALVAEIPPACPSPVSGDSTCTSFRPDTETIVMRQPVTAGPAGIWAVTAVAAAPASIDADPGQVVTDGGTVLVRLAASAIAQPSLSQTSEPTPGEGGAVNSQGMAHGAQTAAGFSADGDGGCSTAFGEVVTSTEFDVRVHLPEASSSGCGPQVPGLVFVASSPFLLLGSIGADPLSLGAPFAWLTAVPILVTLPATGSAEETTTYADPLGWSVDYPASWVAVPFDDTSRVTATGVRISSVPIPIPSPDAATPVPGAFPDVGDVPAGATFIVIEHIEGGPAPDLTTDDSSLPLSVDDLAPAPGTSPYRYLSFRANGLDYQASLWAGTEAVPAADRAAMGRLIGSIRFPVIPPNGVVHGWASLGPPLRHFPVRTGTPWSATRLSGSYVMHGPRGTYVLDLKLDDCRDEGFEGISEEWDADRLLVVLRCANGAVERWDRFGAPVPGNDPWFQAPLAVHPVITAWNGDLIVNVDATVGGLAERDWP